MTYIRSEDAPLTNIRKAGGLFIHRRPSECFVTNLFSNLACNG